MHPPNIFSKNTYLNISDIDNIMLTFKYKIFLKIFENKSSLNSEVKIKMSLLNRQRSKIRSDWPFENIFDDFDVFYDFKDFDERFDDLSKSEGKNYSISYHYETGMNEPEINIKGNPSKEDVNNFLESAAKSFPKLKGKTKLLNAKKEEASSKKFTLEMPGIGKDDLTIEMNGKKVSIEGKKGKLNYKKQYQLSFKPKKFEVSADNGLIDIEFLK